MMHLKRRRLVVQITVKFIVQVDQSRGDDSVSKPSWYACGAVDCEITCQGWGYGPSLLQITLEVRCVARHSELHITPRLVQKVPQRTAGHNVCTSGTALLHSCAYSLNGSIALQALRKHPLAHETSTESNAVLLNNPGHIGTKRTGPSKDRKDAVTGAKGRECGIRPGGWARTIGDADVRSRIAKLPRGPRTGIQFALTGNKPMRTHGRTPRMSQFRLRARSSPHRSTHQS